MWVPLALVLLTTALPPGGTFLDDDGNIHEGSIEAIAAAGITNGCNPPANDLFCPDRRLTRGEMAAFLYDALQMAPSPDDHFLDDDSSEFEREIDALAAAGITRGCNPPLNDRFCPEVPVTRGQMAAFLVRGFGYTDDPPGDRFVDDDSSVFEADIERLAAAGVTHGCNPSEAAAGADPLYCPDQPVPRDQMASFLTRARGFQPVVPEMRTATSCSTGDAAHPEGGLAVVAGEADGPGTGSLHRFRVEVEEGLPVDHGCVADVVTGTLFDMRGWTGSGSVTFHRVDDSSHHFRVILAGPETTDELCAPLDTGGIYSCRVGTRVVLNFLRWEEGTPDFDSMAVYRGYQINHEVGHWLGLGHHNTCPEEGGPAPVMMQQTIALYGGCLPNAWPLAYELAAVG